MNIVHLLSQNHLTGAEVYAATLVREQILNKNHVYQISNGFFYPTTAVKIQRDVETRSRIAFIKNILWLRNFLRKEDIAVVHTHSRAAAKLGFWATFGTGTALVSTVHGVQHSSFSKKLFNQYGRFIIAVCENVKRQLMRDFSYREGPIKVLPNPVSSESFRFTESAATGKIAVIGRTTGPKKTRTAQVFRSLENSKLELFLVGGSLEDLDLPPKLAKRITEIQAPNLTSDNYSAFSVVVGSGRVCIEALLTGTPCIAFGEALYCGLVTPENYQLAKQSNFGDIQPGSLTPQLPIDQFMHDLEKAAHSTAKKVLSELAREDFSPAVVNARIQRLYESAVFLKRHAAWIPVLMYHKVPDQELQSKHKIFVTKNNFEKHLLYFKERGFETITFDEISAFRRGEKNFSQFPKKPLVLTFDDGYRDNLENASPLLKKYGFTAQLFLLADPQIASNSWDAGGNETASEILSGTERQQWLTSAFSVGSHGFSHQKITALTGDQALAELAHSKEVLEGEFKKKVPVFAFTYGITVPASEALAEKAGYDYAVNTDSGGLLMEEQPFAVFRANIFPDESRWSLWKKTSSWYRRYYYFKRKK